MLGVLGSASCVDITHETGGTISWGALGSASCDITHETGGTICYGHWDLRLCYGHWVLRLVISYTRDRGIGRS